MKLTHLDDEGNARMVDISSKKKTKREAVARGTVKMSQATYEAVKNGQGPKGDIFGVAKIAGIQAAKKTCDLVPLCHPIALSYIDIAFVTNDSKYTITITATAKTADRTGVEMEAICAAMMAALTVYDMCKGIDKGIEVGPFFLVEKAGGKSGRYVRHG